MSRHRNLKQYMDDYDDGADDDYYEEDDYGEEEVAPVAQKVKAAPPAKAAASTPAGKKAVSSSPSSTGLQDVRKALGINASIVREDEMKSALDRHGGNSKLAADDLAIKISQMTISVTKPQSNLTRALEERPRVVGGGIPVASTVIEPLKSVPSGGFDFSSPSPDDVVAEARKRQEQRKAPAVVVVAPVTAATGGVAPKTLDAKSLKKDQPPPPLSSAPTTVTPQKRTKADEKRDEEDDAADVGKKPLLSLVVVGHVDAGKSTLMGHLLYDLEYVTQKDMHKFEKESKDMGKASFKFAWVMDEHAEERERGVTIDVGVKRFETKKRRVVLLDAPGHRDFVPNMITGAAQADAAVLVVPAVSGEFESSFSQGGQTKEHAILVHRLGVQKLIVAVNKMDSCHWDNERFDFIVNTLKQFLVEEAGFPEEDVQFVPCSGLTGENLVKRTPGLLPDWVDPRTLEDYLDELPASKRPTHKPLRITVSDSYKSMQLGPFAVGGKIEAGIVRVDDTVLIAPLNVQAKIKVLLIHGQLVRRAKAGENVEIGLASKDSSLGDQLGRAGIVICDPKFPVPVVEEVRARIHTLAAQKFPILNGSHLMFHAHSVAVPCTVKSLECTITAEGKTVNPRMVKRNESAEITLVLGSPVCLERHDDFRPLSRFLLRFSGTTVAAGVVQDIVNVTGSVNRA